MVVLCSTVGRGYSLNKLFSKNGRYAIKRETKTIHAEHTSLVTRRSTHECNELLSRSNYSYFDRHFQPAFEDRCVFFVSICLKQHNNCHENVT